MKRISIGWLVAVVGLAVVPLLTHCSHPQGHNRQAVHPQPSTGPRIVIGGTALDDAVPMLAPDAPPQLVAVRISSDTIHSGDTVMGWVVASSNVASAEIRVQAYSMPLVKDSPGHFSLARQVPHIPSFVKGDYTLSIVARNTKGNTTETSIPIHVR